MAAEATGAAAVAPRSGAGGLEPWQALSPAQRGQTSLPLPPDWHQERPRKRTILLQGLGTFHIFIAMVHVVLGTSLISAAGSLHLVVLKSWYPFWGAASFLFTGISMIAMEMVPKTSLKVLCLVTHSMSIFCVLAGLFVIAKDLFLESSLESLVWRLQFPNRTVVYMQRLELGLFCLVCLELFLAGLTAVITCRDYRLSAKKDDLPLAPDMSLGFGGPPPSYEDVIRSDTRAEQRQR
ncbi:membrane-spanning 4-domains subfamily A member 10 [Phyllostomus hastatus]|uniref:membrane-spanning 4-domains subfamily A member 10 n=1 Tax=Phyllostomus hastatus TaxID=9423 RepID=UPI001E685B99|nr:membrane-spanning 4-domains subfamily A member 10 [Phyllostomus hastatus]XP_045711239.1 membrane-spanning 4-domains subfamily A member 10 [Phyllostomus hastatus]